ncbi:DUF3152 domain-containing protein [Streptomyces europaeiscabiei]|uniref:DUF3152 domain-containing protein n=1 Tax=Streptomyces europaeiscabiei TaxID=146819 RepID=UPI0030E520BC
MGRHSRKGRAPKGDTNDIREARTAASAGAGDRGPATQRVPRVQGVQGAQGVGGPAPPAARDAAAAAASSAGGKPPGGPPPRRRYGQAPGQGMPQFNASAPGWQGPRLPDATPAHGFPRLPDGAPAHAVPRFANGTPAHGVPRLPDGTPAQGFPRFPDGTPVRGYPPSRGGHPEQREAGGGWGHLGGGGPRTGAGHGVAQGAPQGAPYGVPGEAPLPGAPYGEPPERSGRRIPIPRQRQETMPPGGPRQAYLDAFDEVDDVFAPGRTHRAAPGVDADHRVEVALEEKPLHEAHEGPLQEEPLQRKLSQQQVSQEQPPRDGAEGVGAAKGAKGRAFAGIAAAAVTTVLAVVVGGQVAGGQDETATQSQAADAGERDVRGASRSDNRPTPSGPPSPSATPLSYDQKMGKVYALAADLEGDGKFDAVRGFDKAPGTGQKYRYRVDVEKGLGLDAELFAEAVQKTLNDDRSWAHSGGRTFERISSGTPDFVITLASPGTTAFWCAKSGLDTTVDNVSCDSAATERVMINAYRWAQGSETYGDQIHAYRQMLINHEIGHRLGYPHVTCDKDGELAPVMQQQSKFLTQDGITCRANPWPYPGS